MFKGLHLRSCFSLCLSTSTRHVTSTK